MAIEGKASEAIHNLSECVSRLSAREDNMNRSLRSLFDRIDYIKRVMRADTVAISVIAVELDDLRAVWEGQL